jgi:hypothetical protein
MNLLDDCIGDFQDKTQEKVREDFFINTFCKVCRNTQCENSGALSTLFQKRISTQEERLFNPIQTDPSLDKYKSIADFLDTSHQAYKYELSSKRGDWEPPSDQEVENYKPSKNLNPLIQSHIQQPPSTLSGGDQKPSQKNGPQKPPTSNQNGFVDLEGAGNPLPSSKPLESKPKPILVPHDPWATPTPPKDKGGSKIQSGAKIRLNPDGTIKKG